MAQHKCSDHRAITLRNHLLKVHHGYLRSLAYPLIHAALHLAQTGGAKQRGTDVSNALIRWNMFHQRSRHQCSMTFFGDVTAAFYTMIRQLVVPASYNSTDIDDIINQIGIPLAFVEPLKLLMSDSSTLERLIPDKHLLAMLSESQRMPWLQIQGHPDIACTKTGSGPGGPLADFMDNLAMLPAIKEIDQQMVHDGHIFHFPSETCIFLEIAMSARSRSKVSPANVTAFVDDLSGSAPLDVRSCKSELAFKDRIANFISILLQRSTNVV